jgi:hypothetical protein
MYIYIYINIMYIFIYNIDSHRMEQCILTLPDTRHCRWFLVPWALSEHAVNSFHALKLGDPIVDFTKEKWGFTWDSMGI